MSSSGEEREYEVVVIEESEIQRAVREFEELWKASQQQDETPAEFYRSVVARDNPLWVDDFVNDYVGDEAKAKYFTGKDNATQDCCPDQDCCHIL